MRRWIFADRRSRRVYLEEAKTLKICFTFIPFLVLTWFSTPALPQAKDEPVNENPVSLQVHIEPTKVMAGGEAQLTVEMTVAPGHHAYKDMLKLKWDTDEGATLGDFTVNPVSSFIDPVTKKSREGMENQANIRAMVRFPKTLNLGKHQSSIKVGYQVCSAKYCLFPKTVALPFSYEVVGNEIGAADTQNGFLDDGLQKALAKGHLWAYIFVFIGGFLTSLTPCVFPMIPITISIIGARAVQDKRAKAFALSVTYVLGIAFTYSLLGVVAATTGALFGSLLSNVWVVSFIALVFVAMGLSMMGLFEIQVPAGIRNKFGNAHTGTGLAGAFLAGLFAGVVASPCIGPVLVSILTYVAQTANVFFGFTLLFTFALGMGVLFIVLGTFSGLLTKVPRAGRWMEATKFIFGLTFLIMAAYYVFPLLPTGLFHSSKAIEAKKPGLIWQAYDQKLFDQAKLQGKPIILDFSADWCVACHELESFTYTDPQVIKEGEAFTRFMVDATRSDQPMIEELKKRYKVLGLPTIIFINGKGQVEKELTVTGFIKADDFVSRMQKTLK
jgi:thiol:disulfide interchange protein DsbD